MKYQRIVFAQGDDAIEPLQILDNHGIQAVVDYLRQWDEQEGEISELPSSGTSDYVYEIDGFRLSYNLRMGYIGLERIIGNDDEE